MDITVLNPNLRGCISHKMYSFGQRTLMVIYLNRLWGKNNGFVEYLLAGSWVL